MSVAIRRLDVYRDLLDLHRARPRRYPYLLESVAHGTPQSRFDILFGFPGHTITVDGANDGDFLDTLNQEWRRAATTETLDLPLPFTGGWFLFLAYELAGQIEPGLRLPAASDAFPVAFATRCPAAVIRDHEERVCWLVTEDDRVVTLDVMERDLRDARPGIAMPVGWAQTLEDPGAEYCSSVVRILDYIAAGDVFQVNIARRWVGRLPGGADHADVYHALRKQNPAPFAGLVRWGDASIISSSPERLIQARDGVIQTRPIAGTRPRDPHSEKDRAYSRELMGHPKERAEHIMLIDLERNDLGRVCEAGSVEVSELMVLESYAHVHHIVSNVQGRLRDDVLPGDVIRAVFPGGTITGCPKVRCMEIIAELEGRGRGPYTGSMGYLNRDGSMDLNILIRTLVAQGAGQGVSQGDELELMAGAGIVADSEPEQELAETRAKALGLLLALEDRGAA